MGIFNKIFKAIIPDQIQKKEALLCAIDVAYTKYKIVAESNDLIGKALIWDEKTKRGRYYTKEDLTDPNIIFLNQITDILNKSFDIYCRNASVTNTQSQEILKLVNFIEFETDYFERLKSYYSKQKIINHRRKWNNPLPDAYKLAEENFKKYHDSFQKKHGRVSNLKSLTPFLRRAQKQIRYDENEENERNRIEDEKNNPTPYPDLKDSDINLILLSIKGEPIDYQEFISQEREKKMRYRSLNIWGI